MVGRKATSTTTRIEDYNELYLHCCLADLPMEENQYRATLNWLNKRGYHYTREMKMDLARKMAEAGLSHVKIARILDVSESTVRRYLSGGN